jgi:flagellin
VNSILHNAAALSALQALNLTQQALNTTQNQVSSGMSVANASDNAAYWSIAQHLNADSGMVTAANSALSQSQAILDTSNTAIKSIITTINAIQNALTQATNPGADLTNVGTTLASLGQQLTDAVTGASFNGTNILDGSSVAGSSTNTNVTPPVTSVAFVSGFNASVSVNNVTTINMNLSIVYSTTAANNGVPTQGATSGQAGTGMLGAATGTVATSQGGGVSYDLTQLAYYGNQGSVVGNQAQLGTTIGFNTLTTQNIQDMLTAVNATLSNITNYAATIGATQDRMSAMNNLNNALTANYASGVSGLVDADMNTASTRLQALQTQQQLGIQSLSIANQNAQLIMKLFG